MTLTADAEAMHAHAGDASRLLRTLANDQRLLVLCMLVEGELSVSQINERIDLSQSALSQHLARLREEGLVNTRRDAQTIFYSMAEGPAQALIGTLHAIYCGVSEPVSESVMEPERAPSRTDRAPTDAMGGTQTRTPRGNPSRN